jgi:hypothetical protein
MQSDPVTLFLVAGTRIADRQREAEAVRLADIATARVSARRASLRSWLASRLRNAADRVQPTGADLPTFAYRERSAAVS